MDLQPIETAPKDGSYFWTFTGKIEWMPGPGLLSKWDEEQELFVCGSPVHGHWSRWSPQPTRWKPVCAIDCPPEAIRPKPRPIKIWMPDS